MRIAYLILAHKDPLFVSRLLNTLTTNSDNHCFVHIDAKTDVFNDLIKQNKNNQIHWITNRVPVYWGGYNSIRATLLLMEEASKHCFDRYFILQGSDYPIYSNKQIAVFFEKHKKTEFINAVDETIGDKKEWYRYVPKNYLDKPNIIKRIKNRLNADYWRSPLPKIPASCTVEYDGQEHHIFRGWAHFALSHKAIEYIIEFSKTHRGFNNYFRHVYAPDESYFHTIIYNSEFAQLTEKKGPIPESERGLNALLNLTYFEYPSTVRLFKDKSEYEYLKKTGYLFFRKASSESKDLLDYIDSVILY